VGGDRAEPDWAQADCRRRLVLFVDTASRVAPNTCVKRIQAKIIGMTIFFNTPPSLLPIGYNTADNSSLCQIVHDVNMLYIYLAQIKHCFHFVINLSASSELENFTDMEISPGLDRIFKLW
jgi:hypothetical protein